MLLLSRMAVADVGEDAGHLGVFEGEDALARKQHLEENCPEEARSGDAADDRQKKNQRRDEDAEVMQQIACSAKPAEEGSDGEAVDGGETIRAAMGAAVSMNMGGVSRCGSGRDAGGRSLRRQ